MSTIVMSDQIAISASEQQPAAAKHIAQTEVEFAKCECCGLTEECTPEYIERVRERYHGRWICGLCAEAVKDEILRSQRLKMISPEEALNLHMNFCNNFKSSGPPANPTVHLITAMRRILRRSLDSPRALRSTPSSPNRTDGESALTRSGSCFSALSG